MNRKAARGTSKDKRQGIQSIEIGSSLLNSLGEAHGPMTLRDLAADAGMTPSKAHRYLISLLRCGLARQDPVSGRYDLGEMALKLGLASLNRLDPVRFATEGIVELNQRSGLMVILSVWGSRGPTIIALFNSSELVLTNIAVGAVLPVLRSASGRVFLAYLSERTTREYVRKELRNAALQTPPSRIRTEKDVEELIAEVRRDRVGTTRGDLVPGRRAIAAPIFDHQGSLAAVIAIIGASQAIDDPAAILLQCADQVSQRLGYWPRQASDVGQPSRTAGGPSSATRRAKLEPSRRRNRQPVG